jgi:hypothetical protein
VKPGETRHLTAAVSALAHPPAACTADHLPIHSSPLVRRERGQTRHQEIQQPVYHPSCIMCTPCDTNINKEIRYTILDLLITKLFIFINKLFVNVGSPTQQRQPAPSVTSGRGTVLVNFVRFNNRFLFYLSPLKEELYISRCLAVQAADGYISSRQMYKSQ